MAEEFGTPHTPDPSTTPPAGSPMPSDAASKEAEAALKKQTEALKKQVDATKAAQESLVQLTKDFDSFKISLAETKNALKKYEGVSKELSQAEKAEFDALNQRYKQELANTNKVVDSLEQLAKTADVAEETLASVSLTHKESEKYVKSFGKSLEEDSKLTKKLQPLSDWVTKQTVGLQKFQNSITGLSKSIPSIKDSFRGAFALGIGTLLPFLFGMFKNIAPKLMLDMGKFSKKSTEVKAAVVAEKPQEESKGKFLDPLHPRDFEFFGRFDAGILKISSWLELISSKDFTGKTASTGGIEAASIAIQEWLDVIASSLNSINTNTMQSGSVAASVSATSVPTSGGIEEWLNLLVDKLSAIGSDLSDWLTILVDTVLTMAQSVVSELKNIGGMVLKISNSLITSAAGAKEKELTAAGEGGKSKDLAQKSGKTDTKLESKAPKGKIGSFLSAAKDAAVGMLMIAGAIIVLAVGLKLMKNIDVGTLIKTGIAIGSLGAGLWLLSRLNSSGMKSVAQSMLMMAASIGVMAISMMLMGKVSPTAMLKTALVMGAMIGTLKMLSKINSSSLIKSSLALMIMGASLIPLAIGIKLLSGSSWQDLAKAGVAIMGLAGVMYGMSKLPMGSMIKSAISMTILGISLIPMALALRMMAGVEWETIAKLGTALIGLGVVAAVIGKLGTQIMFGAATLVILGLSLIPLALGLMILQTISWSTLGLAAAAILGLSLVAAGLGFAAGFIIAGAFAIGALGLSLIALGAGMAIMGAVGTEGLLGVVTSILALGTAAALIGAISPLVLFGAFVLGALGLAMLPLAGAIMMMGGVDSLGVATAITEIGLAASAIGWSAISIGFGAAALGVLGIGLASLGAGMFFLQPFIEPLGNLITQFSVLGAVGGGLFVAAAGIAAITGALLLFSAVGAAMQVGGAVAGLVSGVLGWFSGDNATMSSTSMLGLFISFANAAPMLQQGASAIDTLATALVNFSKLDLGKMEGLDKITGFMDHIGQQDSGIFSKIRGAAESISSFVFGDAKKPGEQSKNNSLVTTGMTENSNLLTKSDGASTDLLQRILEQLQLVEPASSSAVQANNISNPTITPPAAQSAAGGGSTVMPLYSGSHNDPTKMSYQVSYRPAG